MLSFENTKIFIFNTDTVWSSWFNEVDILNRNFLSSEISSHLCGCFQAIRFVWVFAKS